MKKIKPIIGITVGDPAGIGPEVTIKSLSKTEIHEICKPIVIGSFNMLSRLAKKIAPNLSLFKDNDSTDKKNKTNNSNSVKVIEVGTELEKLIEVGKISAASGEYVFQGIKKCFELFQKKEISGFVMGTITKESLAKAELGYTSEFDIFADLAKVKEVGGVIKWGSIICAGVTGHVPFREIVNQLTIPKIISASRLLYQTIYDFGIREPRIAIAALNPHAGEDGLFGDEEDRIIRPAIENLRQNNINVKGYFPADTIFLKAIKGELDGIVFLYHDQCNIAIKTAAFMQGLVVIYCGLPLSITSPCHGSALDIAGQNKADPKDMLEAIKAAAYLARNI